MVKKYHRGLRNLRTHFYNDKSNADSGWSIESKLWNCVRQGTQEFRFPKSRPSGVVFILNNSLLFIDSIED